MKKTIKDIDLKGKKVLIRVDFNVPIKNGVITSNKRILAALPTIKFALDSGAKVILLSHLGRVKSIEDKRNKSLKIVAKELSKELRQNVIFIPETRGKVLEDAINKMQPKEVLMIENTRFEDLNNSAESKNSKELGKYWASLGDVFINDAFGTVHRSHASNVGIAENIRESAIGFLVQEELSMLAKAIYGNKKPFIAIIGGAKITEKINVINNLIDKVDYLIIGGGMAYTFCASQGISIGSSLVETDKIALAREYMMKYSNKIILPIDSAISKNFSDNQPLFNNENSLEIPRGYMGLDIGPKSINVFKNVLAGAKTVLWNGPMGVAEFDNYKKGTESIANIIAAQPNVFSIIGGGDSAAAIINLGLEKKFSHISTGGGASLQFLEGGKLPGIEAIQEGVKRQLDTPLTKPVVLPQPASQPQPASATLTKPVAVPQPASATLTKPVVVSPVKPSVATPTKPVAVSPVKPAAAPTKPVVLPQPQAKPIVQPQPVKQVVATPTKPVVLPQPINKPSVPQPTAKPVVEQKRGFFSGWFKSKKTQPQPTTPVKPTVSPTVPVKPAPAPTKPVAVSPVKPSVATPTKPVTVSPVKPSVATPTKPVTVSPTKPIVTPNTSEKAIGATTPFVPKPVQSNQAIPNPQPVQSVNQNATQSIRTSAPIKPVNNEQKNVSGSNQTNTNNSDKK